MTVAREPATAAATTDGEPLGGADVDVLVPTAGRPAALAVTLAGLAAQHVDGFRVVVSDQTADDPGGPAAEHPAVQAVVRVLRRRGVTVELGRHLPRRGMAEHRHHLLAQARARLVLFLDDDVLLEPPVLARLLAAMQQLRCGFVGAAMQGASFLDDVRPHEQTAFELWPGPVQPERVRKEVPAWERWRLHNAANVTHLADDLAADGTLAPDGWLAYKVAWVAGCVLFDRQALLDAGGFAFHDRLPAGHGGEDVVAQLRVLERSGGAGVLPSQAWHLELPTTVADRRADAYALVLEADDRAAPGNGAPASAAVDAPDVEHR